MTNAEKDTFEKKSQYHNFGRHMIISYEDNGMTNQEVGEATRDSLSNYFDEGTDFCYAVHRKEDGTVHSHAVVTGSEEKVAMYENKRSSDISDFNEQSKEIFEEKSKQRSRVLDREEDKEREHKTAREKRRERRDRNRKQTRQRTKIQQ